MKTWLSFSARRAHLRELLNRSTPSVRTKEEVPIRIGEEKISELRYQAAETLGRIRLRLNPDEPEHEELLRLLVKAVRIQNEVLANGGAVQPALNAIEAANEYARPVLKKEWKRVKAGELTFRIVRNWLAPIIFVLSLAFLIFMGNGAFKI